MANIVKYPPYTPEPPICDAPDQFVFECLVKSYYHAKFQAFSSKIDRVVAILVQDPLLTPLNPLTLTPLTSLCLMAWSRVTIIQNVKLLAQKLTKL